MRSGHEVCVCSPRGIIARQSQNHTSNACSLVTCAVCACDFCKADEGKEQVGGKAMIALLQLVIEAERVSGEKQEKAAVEKNKSEAL